MQSRFSRLAARATGGDDQVTLYERGVPTDTFTLILQGKVLIRTGDPLRLPFPEAVTGQGLLPLAGLCELAGNCLEPTHGFSQELLQTVAWRAPSYTLCLAGEEEFEFERGPWNSLASRALTSERYMPDFDAVGVAPLRVLRFHRPAFLAALEATSLQPVTAYQVHTLLTSYSLPTEGGETCAKHS